MAGVALTLLLSNLKELGLHYYDLQSGAKDQLDDLMDDLDTMRAFLEDASEQHSKKKLFKKWQKKIKELVYDVEDTIDSCITKAMAEKNVHFIEKVYNFICKANNTFNLAAQVRDLQNTKVAPVRVMIQGNLVGILDAEVSQEKAVDKAKTIELGESSSAKKKVLVQDYVYGFEDETEELITCLTDESEELIVLSIVGMAGIGKTTLAWKIYQHPTMEHEFPTLIWVCVSGEFSKKDVFLTILRQFTPHVTNLSLEELTRKVRKYMKSGKFLMVIDDLWTIEAWQEIQQVLPKSNKISKVLITSRDMVVAQHATTPGREPRHLQSLPDEKSWELLQLQVFGNLDDCPKELVQIGKDIISKSPGLPFAIVIIAGVLTEKYSTKGGIFEIAKEWEKVLEVVGTDLQRILKSKGRLAIADKVLGVSEKEKETEKEKRLDDIISFSFRELPYHLIDCFLYLGMFPEDTEISAWKLTKLWIAEGFIEPKPGKSLEEVARENLNSLIKTNLVEVDKRKANGEVKTCLVHDKTREFCETEAGFRNQNVYQEIKWSARLGNFELPIQEANNYRRLCVHSYVNSFFSRRPKLSRARSFMCFSKDTVNLESQDIPCIIDSFELLRVLEANTIKFPEFPTNLTQLIHLRYITLRVDNLQVLPNSISNLWNLQTLVVETSSRTLDIKTDIWKMTQLRHLKTKASIILKTNGKGEGGENLQTLSRLSPKSCNDDVFNKAKNLRSLSIRGNLATLLDSKCLETLGRLEKLKLANDVYPKIAAENPLRRLPESVRFPPKIRTLTLSDTYLDWMQMSELAKLKTLEILQLKDNAFTGDSWDAGDRFQCLHSLCIGHTNLKFWTVSTDPFPFPKLKNLRIKDCKKLEGVPLELGKNLETLHMEGVNQFAVSSAKKIEKRQLKARRSDFKLVVTHG